MNAIKKAIKIIVQHMNKLIRAISNHHNNHKQLYVFKRFIKNGLYIFDGYHLSRLERFNDIGKINCLFLLLSIGKKAKMVEGIYHRGTYKKCLCDKKSVIAYCPNDDIYTMNRKNYLEFSKDFPYPFAKTFYFDDINHLICSEYIKGNSGRDREHLLLWATKILKLAKSAKHYFNDNTLYYVQHGDAWFDNIIWIDERNFVYIDLDRIGYWPALYDLIYGFVVAFRDEAFIMIEEYLYDEIADLFCSFNIKFSIGILDYYYTCFIKIWLLRDSHLAKKYINPFYSLDERYDNVKRILEGVVFDGKV